MRIDTLVLGEFQANCYVVRTDDQAKACLVIDPGLDAEGLIEFLAGRGLEPASVVLTHGHVDHIAGVSALRKAYPSLRLYVHAEDAPMLADTRANLSAWFGSPCKVSPADRLVRDADTIKEAGLRLRVIHTPGHTPGGICLYIPDAEVVFTGDCLFAGSVGRTDFPGSDPEALIASIRTRLLTLPSQTRAYPGHGPVTTLGQEKLTNPYVCDAGRGLFAVDE